MTALKRLQEWLCQQSLCDGLLVPQSDPHLSEYVPPPAERIRFLTGFTGSAGMLMVGKKEAALFVDGRYELQAPQEVCEGVNVVPWTMENMKAFCCKLSLAQPVLGYDPWTISVANYQTYEEQLNVEFHVLNQNPVDEVWIDKPQWSYNSLWFLDEMYTGESLHAKVSRLQDWLKAKNVTGTFLSDLTNIAWLFNIRGSDLECTPVGFAWAYIPAEGSPTLFINQPIDGWSATLHYVDICAYDDVYTFLETIKGETILLDPDFTPFAVFHKLHQNNRIFEGQHFCSQEKAMKNATEIEGFHRAHFYDALAMCEAFSKLEHAWLTHQKITEYEFGELLTQERTKQPENIGISFPPIVGFCGNGAIIHYRPLEKQSKIIKGNGLLLVDSGGQYRWGTTDVTRTIAFGQPTNQQKHHYTLVLKAHIAVAQAIFPEKSNAGSFVDSWARRELWKEGLDYAHGTGHGVGHCSNVHEGPYGLSPRARAVPIPVGCVLSNEPGFYVPQEYGIRIESLMFVKAHPKKGFQCFETLTLMPMDLNLIEKDLLTEGEVAWLNHYHGLVAQKLKNHLSPLARQWLEANTKAI